MATSTLVLCKPLCFLVTKLAKLEQKVIRTALLDYYNATEITEAKMQLLQDVASLKLSRSSPHTPQRRDGENRSVLEIDDIFKVIVFLDELKLLDQLLKYVTDNPDAMPSIRLFEGDLSHIISRMDRIENRLDNKITGIYSSVAAIAHDIGVINNDIHSASIQNWPALSNQHQQPSIHPPGVSHINLEKPTLTSAVTHGGEGAKNSNKASGVYKQRPQHGNEGIVNRDSTWSARCSTPTNRSTQHSVPHIVRNVPTMSSDSELSDHRQESADDRPYTVQRIGKKRLRSPRQDEGGQVTNVTRRGPLIIGASTPSKQTSSNIKAANKPTVPRKSIFCIGNVDTSCSVEDLCEHVTAMSVRVISCFEAKPRRRRTDNEYEEIVDRRAFRLCINSDDVNNMLDPSKWPAHVYIAEWFFKPDAEAAAPAAKTQRKSVTRTPRSPPRSPPSNTAQDNALHVNRLVASLCGLPIKDVNIFEALNHETLNQEDTGNDESMADNDATILEITVEPDDGSTA